VWASEYNSTALNVSDLGSSSLLVQKARKGLIGSMKSKELIIELLGGMPWLSIKGIEVTSKQVDSKAQSLQKESACPCCGVLSKSIHSHYERTLLDLPWADYGVRVHVAVRRFRCGEKACERKVFTERFTTWISSYARRMARAWEVIKRLSIETSSRSTSRISQAIYLPVSSSATLRKLHTLDLPEPKRASTIIGVDDFAFTRRQSYGTLVVDLETNQPIDLLPDRTAPTLATWLKAHPEVSIISRDRRAEYANGISQGATKATQVLDRWHLLKNLTEALERVMQQQQQAIAKVAKTWGVQPRQRTKNEELAREQKREQRQQRYQAIRSLHEAGKNLSEIQRELGFHPATIRRAIAGDALPERHANHTAPSILQPFVGYLEQRWSEGCRNASQLWRDIKTQGYSGTAKQVLRWAQERREVPFKHRTIDPTTVKQLVPARQSRSIKVGLAPRQLAWLLQKHDELSDDETLLMADLLEAAPQLKTARTLAHDFQALFFKKKADLVEPWLARAQGCSLSALQTFATGLLRELEAFKAAVTLPWSNGPLEGNINKLKFIKRQMYGRASFPLLRKRVLLAAQT
jgi:transposase